MTNSRIDTIAEDFFAQLNLDLLRQKKDVKISIYFDNSVIRSMILGIAGIESSYRIDKQKFDSPELLVQSLAYFGMIKNVNLLPPHQDELVDFLSKKYLLPDLTRLGVKDVINDLLYSVELNDIDKLKELKESGKIADYLSQFKHKSVELFKLNYLLKDLRWNERLKKILSFSKDSIVSIDNSTYDLNKSISSKIFKQLNKEFDKERTNKSKNNFRDALSLTLIKELLEEFKSNKKSIPIFYASTSLIRNVRKNKILLKEFDIQVTVKKNTFTINVLRDSYFFILDSLFQMIGTDEVPAALFQQIQYLKSKFQKGEFDDIYSRSNIETEIEELIFRDKFFLEFWFQRIERENISETIKEIVSFDFLKSDRSVSALVEKDRRLFTNKLSENLNKLKLIEEIWVAIDEFKEEVDNIFKRRNRVDVFTDLGLTRFSLIRCNEIQEITNFILQYKPEIENDDLHSVKTRLISYIINGVYEKKYEDLIVGISVLWVFNKHDLIIKILDNLNYQYGSYYQLALLHAAAIYPANHCDEEVVKKILNMYEKKHPEHLNYKLWIGAGFIYYHIWKRNSGEFLIPEEGIKNSKSNNHYIYQAIEKTEKAYLWLKSNRDRDKEKKEYRSRKYYYALNNLLYFKVRVSNSDDYESWEVYADELKHCKDIYKKLYWQSRFDHTLAIYEYRMFMVKLTSEERKIKQHLTNAGKYINEALKGIPIHKEDYETLRDKIQLHLEQDFP